MTDNRRCGPAAPPLETEMSQKPTKIEQNQHPGQGDQDKRPKQARKADRSDEHHVPGADGPSGAEAEEDNNP